MAKGKRTCKILKEIRRQIAAANGIDLIIEECRYKGDCRGTCPRCEAEVRYLEEQLRERRLSGRAVAIAGISAGMLLMAGCTLPTTKTAAEDINEKTPTQEQTTEDVVEVRSQNPEESSSETISDDDELDEVEEGEPAIYEDGLTTIMQGGESPENISEDKATTSSDDGLVLFGECGPVIVDDNDFYFDPDNIYEAVEEMPRFPGGDEALLEYINKNLAYPPMAAENGIQGRVVVKFVVKKDGSIGDVIVVRSKDPDLDKEAVRVVKTLPDFEPGEHNGQPVNVWFTIPVTFKLKSNQTD
ncbi:MAG: energy transducer TonB [Muribaculaceae bacterium]|nr:energy transducer TonB [Muribaculaceae bacterium]